jgi:hypothetical protein
VSHEGVVGWLLNRSHPGIPPNLRAWGLPPENHRHQCREPECPAVSVGCYWAGVLFRSC